MATGILSLSKAQTENQGLGFRAKGAEVWGCRGCPATKGDPAHRAPMLFFGHLLVRMSGGGRERTGGGEEAGEGGGVAGGPPRPPGQKQHALCNCAR